MGSYVSVKKIEVMKIIINESQLKTVMSESVTRKELYELFNEFAFMISLNFTHLAKKGKDHDSNQHLKHMVERLNSPIINGKTYSTLLLEFDSIVKNPKFLSAYLLQTKNLIEYIEPRIERYVEDGDYKSIILNKINKFKNQYINIVS